LTIEMKKWRIKSAAVTPQICKKGYRTAAINTQSSWQNPQLLLQSWNPTDSMPTNGRLWKIQSREYSGYLCGC
jgi:hypothetical protein